MQLDRRRIESALSSKGFVADRAGDHRFFHHECEGKRTGISTRTSHGSSYKTYGDTLLSAMRKQLELDSVAQLADLVDCPMSQDAYNQHLRDKGFQLEPGAQSGGPEEPVKPTRPRKRRRRR